MSSAKSGEWYAIIMALPIAVVGLYGCGASETADNGSASATNQAGPGCTATSGCPPTDPAGPTPGADRDDPSTPTGLTGSASSPSQINLKWNASTDNVAVAGYRVYRNGTVLVTLGNVTAHQNTGLSASTTYSYTVQAFDAAGNASAQSTAAIVTTPTAPDTVAPSTPTGLVATAVSASRVHLSWSASTDDVAVTGYRVFRNGALLLSLGNVTAYQDSSLIAGTTYVYTVRALDAAGNNSGHSAAASATTSAAIDTTPPTTPIGLTANAVSPSQVNLNWSASTDNDEVSHYNVYRNGVFLAGSTLTTYPDSGLSPSTTYSYTVRAIDETGNVSGLSAAAVLTTPNTPDIAAPTTPTGLTATAVSTFRINLSWVAATDNVGVTGYRIFRNGSLLETVGNVTTYASTGLAASTTYLYAVRALDAAGNISGLSGPASATTAAAPDTTAPTTPTGLSATTLSASRIGLDWIASTDNFAVTGYRVYRNGIFLAALGKVTTYESAGLTPATTYTYNVDAIDAAGNASGTSAAASATTLGQNTATLAWNPVTYPGVVGYRVYFGTAPGTYFHATGSGVDVGNATVHTMTGLNDGIRYYFAVTAYDASNVESIFSNEVFKDIP